MKERQVWNWTFLGFETSQKNRLVQSWFDGLSEDVRDEVRDIFTYLQVAAITEWKRPRFSLLDDGVSEIRFSCNSITYRIYGCFWPENLKQSYTLLHGTEKKVRNDIHGKKLAKDKLGQLKRREATTHQFEF